MSVETQIIEDWLYETLVTDPDLFARVGNRAYSHRSPQTAVYPLILFSPQASNDINTLGQRGTNRTIMLVKAINEGQSTPREIADQIDLILQDRQVNFNGVLLRWKRLQIIEYPEDKNGKRYNHLGGLYRCFAG
jgi:hypothetical protein